MPLEYFWSNRTIYYYSLLDQGSWSNSGGRFWAGFLEESERGRGARITGQCGQEARIASLRGVWLPRPANTHKHLQTPTNSHKQPQTLRKMHKTCANTCKRVPRIGSTSLPPRLWRPAPANMREAGGTSDFVFTRGYVCCRQDTVAPEASPVLPQGLRRLFGAKPRDSTCFRDFRWPRAAQPRRKRPGPGLEHSCAGVCARLCTFPRRLRSLARTRTRLELFTAWFRK